MKNAKEKTKMAEKNKMAELMKKMTPAQIYRPSLSFLSNGKPFDLKMMKKTSVTTKPKPSNVNSKPKPGSKPMLGRPEIASKVRNMTLLSNGKPVKIFSLT